MATSEEDWDDVREYLKSRTPKDWEDARKVVLNRMREILGAGEPTNCTEDDRGGL